ncbi:MAG: hypothetical protein EPO23_00720 [Xanthobacteraceae bacterium]|nr:MAG: hypothetical protein EPO23_00720 [Xanthobacteraceae bacterium]
MSGVRVKQTTRRHNRGGDGAGNTTRRKSKPASAPELIPAHDISDHHLHNDSIGDAFHLCALYDSSSDFADKCAALSMLSADLAFRHLYILDDVTSKHIGVAFNSFRSANDLIMPVDSLIGPLTAPVKISLLIDRLRSIAAQVSDDGYGGIFVLFDMSWIPITPSGLANHRELEVALHQLAESPSIRVACFYNRALFPPNILLDVLRAHPAILVGDTLRANPYYLPPVVLLGGDAEQKLNWWMANLEADATPVSERSERARETLPGAKERIPAVATSAVQVGSGFIQRWSDAEPESLTTVRWKIRCLGDLRVYRHGGDLVEWNGYSGATHKTKTLFALLLERGTKGAGVEEVADLLWPEARDIDQSLNRLYHTVHCLRLALSPHLKSSRNSPFIISRNKHYYLVLPEATWIDVPVFEQYCRQGEKLMNAGNLDLSLTCHQAAEHLYTGSLYGDIPLEYVEDRERDWCWSRRYWIEAIYLKMLACMATIHRKRQDAGMSLLYCERVLKIDPCSERAHQEAMRTYHQIGRRDALERQYRLCRESLRRYEERQPSPETVVLARELIA